MNQMRSEKADLKLPVPLAIQEVERDYPKVYAKALELKKQRDDIRLFMHACEHCGKFWECGDKAARCPECGRWHLTMSSRLKDSPRRIE